MTTYEILDQVDSLMKPIGEDVMRVAEAIMQASDHEDRLITGAALCRAMAGFWARQALESGDTPEVAREACETAGNHAADLAAHLLRERRRASAIDIRMVI